MESNIKFLDTFYRKKNLMTHPQLQVNTRAPCYKGINERPSYFVLTSSVTSGYHDIFTEQVVWYDGAGLKGNQKMIGENLKLRDTSKPLFVFNKEGKNRWRYIGVFRIAGSPETVKDGSRKVFKFPIVRWFPDTLDTSQQTPTTETSSCDEMRGCNVF